MNIQAMKKILGTGMLHDGTFGAVIREHFPTATQLDLYGAGVTFDADGEIVSISCQGRTVQIPRPSMNKGSE